MNFTAPWLIAGLVFGVIGMYLIKRAKSEAHIPYALIGVALIAYPYFVENIYILWGVGVALTLLALKI